MIKFPSIGQFRDAIKQVRRSHKWYVTNEKDGFPLNVVFRGTVKLHGANCAIGLSETGDLWSQSRNRVLTETERDSFGFYEFVMQNEKVCISVLQTVKREANQKVVVYGEWCGGNVQKTVALNQLPKMFVIFAARVIDDSCDDNAGWLRADAVEQLEATEQRIFNIYKFANWNIEIDFEKPEASQAALERITNAVESECPVAAALGVKGIGEGVVWHAFHPIAGHLRFKVKGDKHAVVKSNKSAPVDAETLASINAFVDYAVTENRLQQGLVEIGGGADVDRKQIGTFIGWVQKDLFKEEAEALAANNLCEKDAKKAVGAAARKWFLKHC